MSHDFAGDPRYMTTPDKPAGEALKALLERLRRVGYLNSDNGDYGPRNPDGAEAVDVIEALLATATEEDLRFASFAVAATGRGPLTDAEAREEMNRPVPRTPPPSALDDEVVAERLARMLSALAVDCENTDGWEGAARDCRDAAAILTRIKERSA